MNALTAAPEPAMLGFLQRAITDPDFDVNKFEVVLRAVREEQAKQAERAFYAALAETQGAMEPIARNATNPHTRSKYASFEAIDSSIRPIYTRNGFCVSYRTDQSEPGTVRATCVVAHNGGHKVEGELTAALDSAGSKGQANKTSVQAVGSTVSYLRRYLLSMMFNVALIDSGDDDGESLRRTQPPPRERYQNGSSRREDMDRTMRGDDIPKGGDLPRMLAEVATMDQIRIETIGEDQQWMADVRDLFPPDRDRLREAMRHRLDELRGSAE